MITNPRILRKFEMEIQRKEKINISKNFRIIDALYDEAVTLRAIPMRNQLDGLEIDIKIARVVNSV